MRNLHSVSRRGFKTYCTQYDKVLYPDWGQRIQPTGYRYIDIWHYPDGHKELRLNDVLLPYSTYDRLSEVDPVAIVDNKRTELNVLDVARRVQKKG